MPRHLVWRVDGQMSSGGDEDEARSDDFDDFDADGEEEESQARLGARAPLQAAGRLTLPWCRRPRVACSQAPSCPTPRPPWTGLATCLLSTLRG